MKVVAYEGVVENGCVHLPPEADVPEKSKVYILVPEPESQRTAHVYSPRLSDPSQARFFELTVTEEGTNG
jgi:hypothetical protein